MAKIVWDKTEDIKNAIDLIPPVLTDSQEDFRPPNHIESDFTRLLAHDVPHTNFTFQILENWYYEWNVTRDEIAGLTAEQLKEMYAEWGTRYMRLYDDDEKLAHYFAVKDDGTYEEVEDYKPEYIRAQMTPIDWKSKIGNSDMSTNFKTDYSHKVDKGDMVIREDSIIYMLNWNITMHPNNQATQAVECNAIVDFTREVPDKVDERGFLIEAGGRKVIVPKLPISFSEYAGRPDYSGASGQPGVSPDHLISVYVQWNPLTKKIHLDDQFIIGDFTYKVINVVETEVQVDRDYGVLTINAKRVAGGVGYDG